MPKFIGQQGVAKPAAPTKTYLGTDLVKINQLTPAQYMLRSSIIQAAKAEKTLYCLCQDCLKVYPYTDERHEEKERCSCGGQLCGCDSCSKQATQIKLQQHHQSLYDFDTVHKK